jgi:hypothetical protein
MACHIILTLKEIVKGLINAINDDQQPVRNHIHKSLCALGDKEPLMVLSKGLHFLNTVSRGQKNHRVLVMNVLRDIINAQKTLKMPDDLAQGLVIMSTLEIVAEKSIDSDWQDSACKLLISLARVVPDTVAKNLIDRFPATQLPHYFVVKALADFAHLYRKSDSLNTNVISCIICTSFEGNSHTCITYLGHDQTR